MQTVTKLSKKAIAKSLVSFVTGTLGLYVLVVCMILIEVGASGFIGYFSENQQSLLTVAISFAVLSAMLYCYFFFENKAVLAKYSKTTELFLIIYILFLNT